MSQSVAIIRSIGGLVFDAQNFSEKHEVSAEITQIPVETGVNVADHMFMKPIHLVVSAGVSNVLLKPVPNDQFSGGSSRSQKAYELLTQLQASFEPFDVQTGLKLYKNMVCKEITCIQDKDTSGAFIFEAELEEVIFVSTQMVTLPPLASGATQRQAGSAVQRNNLFGIQLSDAAKQVAIMSIAQGTNRGIPPGLQQ